MSNEVRTARDEAERLKRIDKEPESVLELFAGHPERWTQGVMARNKNGRATTSNAINACSWCLIGALGKIYNDAVSYADAYERLYDLDVAPTFWNDVPERTFEEVVELCRKAKI